MVIERLFTPRKGEHGPSAQVLIGRIADTGGGWYRPAFKTQNPATDPKEPYGSESYNTGTDHGWANCTMSAGAMALDFDTLGKYAVWGGDMRHHQSDMSGGTDLNDLKQAWAAYGQTLTIRSGAGWDDVEADREAGRALVLQGEGGTPGAGTYTGGHAICVLPEKRSDSDWLIGNPECNGFEWVSPSALRDWAENWSNSIAWARSDPHLPGGGAEMPAVQLTGMQAFSGSAVVRGSNHQWIRVWDGYRHSAADGWTKEVVGRARLDTAFDLGNGSSIAAGTPVVLIGDDLAILLEADIDLTGNDNDADVAEAVEARDAEWIAHLTPD